MATGKHCSAESRALQAAAARYIHHYLRAERDRWSELDRVIEGLLFDDLARLASRRAAEDVRKHAVEAAAFSHLRSAEVRHG